MAIKNLSGFNDFLPAKALQRDLLLSKVKSCFELYGFAPLETPAAEAPEVFEGKTGEEAQTLTFKILKRGRDLEESFSDLSGQSNPKFSSLSDMALRYDLTVPLARVIAQYANEIKFPFKRYQIANVWRAESAQKGRFREFYQCDADIVGSSSMSSDAEIISMIASTVKSVGLDKFKIRINNRIILDGLCEEFELVEQKDTAFRSLDKIEKIGPEAVIDEMIKNGLDQQKSTQFIEFVKSATSLKDPEGLKKILNLENEKIKTGFVQLEKTWNFLDKVTKDKVTIDLSIVRGLDYYTGNVFETTLDDAPEFGSIMSGGRYDKLIGMFSGKEVPAVGASLGFSRIYEALKQLEIIKEELKSPAKYFIALFSEEFLPYAAEIAQSLREKGIGVYLSNNFSSIGNQLALADDLKISKAIIIGEDEQKNGTITVKDLTQRTQEVVKLTDLLN